MRDRYGNGKTTRKRGVLLSRAICFLISGLSVLTFLNGTPASAQTNLLTNGNFETGTFAGWTVANVRDASDVNTTRNFYLDTPGTTTPPVSDSAGNSFFFNTASNIQTGGGGSYYAVTTSDAPGETALLQNFTIPALSGGGTLNVTFTFDLFVNDQSGYSNTVFDPSGLDYTTGGTYNGNQYARVDLLRTSSSDFSTSVSDVLFNVPLTIPSNDSPNDSPNPYKRYSMDLSPYVQRGGTYKIRFAEVDNLGALNLGVDNVSITATTTAAIPEPSALALIACPSALFITRLRRRTNRRGA